MNLRRIRNRPRGIALLMALLMVVLLTASVADFNYSSRTRIMSAAHQRDDMVAYYLAKSGIRIYSLLLTWGRSAGSNPLIGQLFSALGMQFDGPAMVCKSLPSLDTGLLRYLTGVGDGMMSDKEEEGLLALLNAGGVEGPKRGELGATNEEDAGDRRAFLTFPGDFKIDCSDQNAGVDLNGLAAVPWLATPLEQHPVALMMYGLMASEEYDPLFEDRLDMDRWELIANIKDYVDADEQRSGKWGGDEDSLYDDFQPRGHAKNAKLDTLAEARMIAGVTDEVFETFSPSWSVLSNNYKVNVNTAPAHMLRAVARAFAEPYVADIDIEKKVQLLFIERNIVPFKNADQFQQRLTQPNLTFPLLAEVMNVGPLPPIPIQPALAQAMKQSVTTDTPLFHLSSTGYIGDSTRTLDARVRVERNGQIKILDWKER